MTRLRGGFVLVTVLWYLTALSVLGIAALLLARGSVREATNRIGLLRAEWRAEACIAAARAAMVERVTLRRPGGEEPERLIGFIAAIEGSPLVTSCPGAVELRPSGATIDINLAPPSLLSRALQRFGIPARTSDSMTAALVDWRDPDDSASASGAERDWYDARGLLPPRNGPLASIEELRDVRGFDDWFDVGEAGLPAVLGTDGTRVLVTAAPAVVLEALPGFDAASASALTLALRRTDPPRDPLGLLGMVPPDSRPAIERAYGELLSVVSVAPERWTLRAAAAGEVTNDSARLVVAIELSLIQDGGRFAVVGRRVHP